MAAVAGAETNVIDVHDTAGLVLRSKRAQIIVSTWDRPQIRIDSAGPITVEHQTRTLKLEGPAAHPIPILAVKSADGTLELPQEQFVVQMPPEGTVFDDTVITGAGVMHITVPQNLTYLGASLARGHITLRDLKTTFIIKINTGGVIFNHVSGEGYVQVLLGPISIRDSTFTRLRARTGKDDVVMERCHAKQIEVASINGSVVYDNGTFEPGIAHFESATGDVAIGLASGGAQIGGQTQGQIFTALDHGSNASARPHEVNAVVNGGGPYVSIASSSGTLYVYNGSLQHNGNLMHRPNLPPEWDRLDRTMHRFRTMLPGPAPAPEVPRGQPSIKF